MTKFIDLESRKSSTCKKIKQEEQERRGFDCGDFGASRSIILTVLKLLMVQIDNFRTSKLFPPLGDSQGSFALRSVNGTVGARVVARCALRSPSS